MIYASLYHVDSTLPTLETQKEKWPKAASHDGSHYLFPDSVDGVEGIFISDLVDEEGSQLSGDALAWALSKLIASPDNKDLVIYGTYSQFSSLHKHPAWKIWCAKYGTEEGEGRSKFQEDWNYVGNLVPGWPEYSEEITYQNGRELLYLAVTNSSDEET